MRSYQFLLVLSLAFGGCWFLPTDPNKPPVDPPVDPPSAGRTVLFDVVHENYAWGYRYEGVYVDDAGDLYSFVWSQGMAKPSDKREDVTADELKALHDYSPTFIRRIGGDTVARMKALVAEAAQGPYSDTTMYGADMGASDHSAYRFDPTSKRYQKIGMRLRGDHRYDNLSRAGQTIGDWLERLR